MDVDNPRGSKVGCLKQPGDGPFHPCRLCPVSPHAGGTSDPDSSPASPRPTLLPDTPEAPGPPHQPASATGPGVGRAQAKAIHLLAQHQPAGTLPQVSPCPTSGTIWTCLARGPAALPARGSPHPALCPFCKLQVSRAECGIRSEPPTGWRARMAAVDPLLCTSDHPSCSCSFWAGAHFCLHHLQSQAVYLSALLFSSQAPSWWARQPASLVGRNQEFWAQKHLARSPPVTSSWSLCRHSWLRDTLSSLVMCVFIVERKQNHSQLNASVSVCTSPPAAVG